MLLAQLFKAGKYHEEFTEKLVVTVRDPRPKNYHPTNAHRHGPVPEPEGWNKVCEEAGREWSEFTPLVLMARAKKSPPYVVEWARKALFLSPNGRWHFDYYLSGKGGVVNEDALLTQWIEGDSKARVR